MVAGVHGSTEDYEGPYICYGLGFNFCLVSPNARTVGGEAGGEAGWWDFWRFRSREVPLA